MLKFQTNSDNETIRLGKNLGKILIKGDIIALVGELGSGKTWFAKGLALGLGLSQETVITSPSFSIVNEYPGPCSLYHIDAYRLNNRADFLAAGLDEYFYKDGVVAMEWADRWPEILPGLNLKVELEIIDEHCRLIKMSGNSARAEEIIKAMK